MSKRKSKEERYSYKILNTPEELLDYERRMLMIVVFFNGALIGTSSLLLGTLFSKVTKTKNLYEGISLKNIIKAVGITSATSLILQKTNLFFTYKSARIFQKIEVPPPE